MGFILKRLSLGLILIVIASLVLLVSDWNQRNPKRRQPAGSGPSAEPAHSRGAKIPRIAILKLASRPILDDTVAGMLVGLKEGGFVENENIKIQYFSAENDLPTANTIAKQITTEGYDLVLTASTPALQVMARANRDGRVMHVFAAVTDPAGAGVGISATNPLDHPRHLVGIGTFQPVERTFELAKRMHPDLRAVGAVWNPGESCSTACIMKARAICEKLGIRLVEKTVDSSTGVLEAANALVATGVQAIWSGGDNTVELAITSVIDAANRGSIPVFVNSPSYVELYGAFVGLGADYFAVGREGGVLAARILNGLDPTTVRIENVVPEKLYVNKRLLPRLKEPWQIPPDVLARADGIYDETGFHAKTTGAKGIQPGRVYRVGIAYFSPASQVVKLHEGLIERFEELGFHRGRNLELVFKHANAEIPMIPSILESLDNEGLDIIMPMSTPCVTAAIKTVKRTPIVFTYCYDPIAAGVGKSFQDHLPNVTGVGSFPPVAETLEFIEKVIPGLKAVGVIYNSSEANSRKVIGVLRPLFQKKGLRLQETTVTSTNEVYEAAEVLVSREIQAIWIAGDNTAMQAMDAVAKIADEHRIAMIANDPIATNRGELFAVGIGWHEVGRRAAEVAARVLLGEKPGNIPIENLSPSNVVLNYEQARKLGVVFPEEILARAKNRPTRKHHFYAIAFVDAPHTDESLKGFRDELTARGLVEGKDYEMPVRNAHGDAAVLGSIVDDAASEPRDLVYVISTPALQKAIKKIEDTPIVFTCVADPVAAGAARTFEDHLPNVTGVTSTSDFEGMIKFVRKLFPSAKTIGTLFAPAEVNSVIYKERLERVSKDAGLRLEVVPASTPTEVADAANVLCSKRIDVLCQISDNLGNSCFSSIAQAARKSNVPVLSFVSQFAQDGLAVAAVARDFHQCGRDAAVLATRILDGENPARIPIMLPSKTRLVINKTAAGFYGVRIPPDLLQQADEVIEK